MTAAVESGAMRLSEIARALGGEVVGEDVKIRGAAPLDQAGGGDIAFFDDPRYRARLAQSRAGALIVRHAAAVKPCIVVAENPRAYIARVVGLLRPPPPAAAAGVHPSAVIGDGADIAADAAVGAFACVGRRAHIGAGAQIGAHCVIGDEARIGAGGVLHPRVTVYPQSVVGARCVIHAGAVIGADGFGFAAADGGRREKIPQLGRAVLGCDVEVGANAAIDRGALGDTEIGDGVKIDNLAQIGHNVKIGANSVVCGCAAIAGSAIIGAGCVIGGAVRIGDHLTIAPQVTICGGSVVLTDIKTPGAKYAGVFPAVPAARWWRAVAVWRRRAAERRVKGLSVEKVK